jgi:metal-responsive CopG/Arc/MetJ family transcriptional regulator
VILCGVKVVSAKVIQVPIDQELSEALDSLSETEGRSRAELIREACRLYLRRLEEERLNREYVKGYVRIPEEPALGEAQAALAGRVLPKEKW